MFRKCFSRIIYKKPTCIIDRRLFSTKSLFAHVPTTNQQLARVLFDCAVDETPEEWLKNNRSTVVNLAREETYDYCSTIALRRFEPKRGVDDNFDDSTISKDDVYARSILNAAQFSLLLNKKDMIDKASVNERGIVSFRLSDEWIARQTADWFARGKVSALKAMVELDSNQLSNKQQIDDKNNNNNNNNNKNNNNVDVLFCREKQNILVDFASPNMAKELHVGHLRSTVIGDALCNVLEFVGHDVKRVSHVGDVGTPVALVVAMALELRLPWTDPDTVTELPTAEKLSELYRLGRERTLDDASFRSEVQRQLLHIQQCLRDITKVPLDDRTIHAWINVCKTSRLSFESLLERLGVSVQERGESRYLPHVDAVIKRLRAKNLLRTDAGALVADARKASIVVRKRNGTVLYSTTDLAAAQLRAQEHDRALYVVDASQQLHFQQVFDLAARAGLYDPSRTELLHVPFGVIQGKDRKKFSTRRGTGEQLSSLLDNAAQLVRQSYADKRREKPHTAKHQDTLDIDALSEAIGVASVKFFDLKHDRTGNYVFDFHRMLDMQSGTGMYVLYTYARIAQLRQRANNDDGDVQQLVARARQRRLHEHERKLMLIVTRFDDVVLSVENSLKPHHLCDYIISLAEQFNRFYVECPVLQSSCTESRLALVCQVEYTLKTALQLLGIQAIPKI